MDASHILLIEEFSLKIPPFPVNDLEVFLNITSPPAASDSFVSPVESIAGERNGSIRKSMQCDVIMTQIRKKTIRGTDFRPDHVLIPIHVADVLGRFFDLHPVGVVLVPLIGERGFIVL